MAKTAKIKRTTERNQNKTRQYKIFDSGKNKSTIRCTDISERTFRVEQERGRRERRRGRENRLNKKWAGLFRTSLGATFRELRTYNQPEFILMNFSTILENLLRSHVSLIVYLSKKQTNT